MVVSGYDSSDQADVGHVAERTIQCLANTVPPAVPGVVFLSGGQSDEDATARLNAMNQRGPHPWELSFSYGRALQAPALKAWGGEEENVEAAQQAYYHRAKMNGAARTGSYAPDRRRKRRSPSAAARFAISSSFSNACVASMRRTVPERERMTIESVERAVARVADAAQERAGRDAGGGEEDVLAADEVVGRQHPVEVVAGVDERSGARRPSAARACPGSRRRRT